MNENLKYHIVHVLLLQYYEDTYQKLSKGFCTFHFVNSLWILILASLTKHISICICGLVWNSLKSKSVTVCPKIPCIFRYFSIAFFLIWKTRSTKSGWSWDVCPAKWFSVISFHLWLQMNTSKRSGLPKYLTIALEILYILLHSPWVPQRVEDRIQVDRNWNQSTDVVC